ncbi:hypothetical protein TNCV_4752661 [Trichonephila clavipes]|nr:hypothetical protein TNCV_4752661 [Trichonephila clavipes]
MLLLKWESGRDIQWLWSRTFGQRVMSLNPKALKTHRVEGLMRALNLVEFSPSVGSLESRVSAQVSLSSFARSTNYESIQLLVDRQ